MYIVSFHPLIGFNRLHQNAISNGTRHGNHDVHISQICNERIDTVESRLSVGDVVRVKVVKIDEKGRVNLTMKNLPEEG